MNAPADTSIRFLVLTQEQFDKLREYAVGNPRTPGHDSLCERIWSKTRMRGGIPVATLGPDDIAHLLDFSEKECACGCQILLRAILEQQPNPDSMKSTA